MSQVLQCTQLAALICRRLPAAGAVVDDLVDAGRAEARAGVVVLLGAARRRRSWCRARSGARAGPRRARSRRSRRRRGGRAAAGCARRSRVRATRARSSLRCERQSGSWFFSVHGDRPAGHRFPAPRSTSPNHRPRLKPGLMLRTCFSSAIAVDARSFASKPVGAAGLRREVLGGEHAAADRLVRALDLRHVEQAGGVADQQRAGHLHLRQRLPAAGDDRARAGRRGSCRLRAAA